MNRDGFPGLIDDDLTDPRKNSSKAFCSKLIGFARFHRFSTILPPPVPLPLSRTAMNRNGPLKIPKRSVLVRAPSHNSLSLFLSLSLTSRYPKLSNAASLLFSKTEKAFCRFKNKKNSILKEIEILGARRKNSTGSWEPLANGQTTLAFLDFAWSGISSCTMK